MPTAARPYHHGALRERLVATAIASIEKDGVADLSLRSLARDAGVSTAAPYHHFSDRAALYAAIVVDGHRLLLERLTAARAGAPDATSAVSALLVAYALFAAEHPAHMRVMLRPELAEPARHPEVLDRSAQPVALLREVLRDAQRDGALVEDDLESALHLFWSLAVGFVTLWVDGPIEARCVVLGTTPVDLMRAVARRVDGMLRRPA